MVGVVGFLASETDFFKINYGGARDPSLDGVWTTEPVQVMLLLLMLPRSEIPVHDRHISLVGANLDLRIYDHGGGPEK